MSLDVVDLRNFYSQGLGVVARRFIGRGIRSHWRDLHGLRLAGIGYATPYLGLFREEAERCLAFMPALLRESWRVLSPNGRLLAVIPNRRGLWARTDTTPFGYGRPYSRAQITNILRETWFTPNGWGEALYVPPVARGWFLRTAVAWERAGATISAPFAGVHIVEATKQVYRAIPARREKRQLVPALEPALAPSTGGAARSQRT